MIKRTLLGLTLISLLSFPLLAANAKDGSSGSAGGADQTENNYYWEGTQLYNLGRLGEAFESFEKAIQRKQNSKEAEAYLLQIRQEIVTNAKQRAKDKDDTINYRGATPDSALNVTYLQKGYIKVVLQGKFLFDENTASLKSGSIDIINRLADLIQSNDGSRIDLTMLDEVDATVNAKDIDAERALVVFSLINFKRLAAANSNS